VIIEWMLYQCATALMLGLAALAAERLVAMRGWARRGVWSVSLAACLVIPAVATLEKSPAVASAVRLSPAVEIPQRQSPRRSDADIRPEATGQSGRGSPGRAFAEPVFPVRPALTLRRLERPAKWIWTGLTLCTLGFYAFAIGSLHRSARHWPRRTVEGCTLRIAPTAGPAVLGYFRPEIILPEWLLESSASRLRLVIAHERAHVAARDSLLWLCALLSLALVPWSIPMIWQVRRLRFAIEVDCDARVIRCGAGLREYGHALLAVSHRKRLASMAALSMAARPSVLERRLSILAAVNTRNAWLAGGLVGLFACCLAAAAAVPRPRDASEVIEPQPAYNSPVFLASAESAARKVYPALFRGELSATVAITVDLGIDGRVFKIEKREFPPGPLPVGAAIPPEETDELFVHDAYHFRASNGGEFLGWFGPRHHYGLYLRYLVLQWPPDPSRSAARVRAAVAKAFPEFFRAYPARDARAPWSVITVFMNEDGTINRSSLTRLSTTGVPDEERMGYQRLLRLGLSPAQFALRGTTGNWQDPLWRLKYADAPPLMIDYAWPRRPGDPPDEISEPPTLFEKFNVPNPADSNLPDTALLERLFPKVAEHGPDSKGETLWVILDPAGRLWAAGKSEEFATTMMGVEALYPGITLGGSRARYVDTAAGTPVMFSMWWLGADSPVRDRNTADLAERADLIAKLQIFRNDQVVAESQLPLKIGTPVARDIPGGRVEIAASGAGPASANLSLRIDSADTSLLPLVQPWSSPVVEVAYGDQANFALTTEDSQSWHAVLRPIRMPQPTE